MKRNNAYYLCLTAVMAALITVFTFAVHFSVGSSNGYIHFGDTLIYLSGCLLGPFGIIASSIGGALSDIISGFPLWALPTAIIKALNCLPFVLATKIQKKKSRFKIICFPTVLALIVSSLVTVAGYFVAEIFLYSKEAALLDIPSNSVQAAGSAVLFFLAGAALDKLHIDKYLSGR
ncbi:MAG: ECF transporter S component [Clostridia bacterium]|nr:ECF transporter S component [Clostridia bacterium]